MSASANPRPDARSVLAKLVELTAALGERPALDQALALVADTALVILPAQHASVRMLDASQASLLSVARAGTGLSARPLPFRPGEGVIGWVVKEGQSALVEDAAADERFSAAERQGFLIRSMLCVPMWSQGIVVGVLGVTSSHKAAFSPRDRRLLELVANAATPLVDRVRVERLKMVPKLRHALASPLRLRLVVELLEVNEVGLGLEDAVLRTGRHAQDVEACLGPLVRWGVVEHDGVRYRLRARLPAELRHVIDEEVAGAAELLARDKSVRRHLLGGLVGVDPKMQIVFEIVQQVARIDVAVAISGETGTGKELVARALHDLSPRRQGFFGAVSCATLSEHLFESQLFGHVRGAFTGASADFVGLAERCHKGTLFLDEVGELGLPNQAKLLRLLQEGSFSRLGESQVRRSDFRVVSATNRDLQSLVQAGSFREDLYYRLAVVPIRIPALREHIGDLRHLVFDILEREGKRFHLQEAPPIDADALERLERYAWPGNVRELENVLARAVVMSGGGTILVDHLPEVELRSERAPASGRASIAGDTGEFLALRTLDEVERDYIKKLLTAQRGNITVAAELLGISRTTLYKKIRDYRIEV